ncbi:MarR family transcriptional regulator [Pedobacter sp. BS3]|uniref:MarR family winged helix-turn-helix transcriptional regulator n=1 Tax=Pedobacter sp. BS3 TaxID=2567937 RepID=UPI0011F06689|nr:MarR family transcriptional regulator [Pedobacter sp. BS3]TZF85004.1 MarR family transcriptional regulator [Pedobacter sp. BS3]
MELEKEIITDKFKNQYHKAIVNVLYTNNWITQQLKKRLAKYHVTLQQFNILRILRGQYPKPATINLLKERMLDKMSDASRIVDRMIQKDLVTRCTNKFDRRAVDIIITEKGLKILETLDEEMTGTDIIGNNLTIEDATRLNFLLDKFRGK